ncbi:MAG: 16S rRNA (adenine(1518)-N(6)/adenine(1519)-N(6))-dimethyltransferase RsmA [Pseudomonadota bacterium]
MSGPIDDLPPLRDVIAAHDLAAKKALGQNFLLDLNITMKIARTVGDLSRSCVVEVGPGPGGLTRALLASGAKRVIAIERDDRCRPALEEISTHYPGRLDVHFGDALKIDPAPFAAGEHDIKIIANLPYNVATPLVTGWMSGDTWPPFWSGMALMFQKEVAQRLTAKPGDKTFGRLSVLTGWRCHAEIAFDLSPKMFVPPPKVTSSVVQFEPRNTPLPCDQTALETVTKSAFGQRRKMLRQSLKPLGGEALLERADIDPTRRAETLSIKEFAALANALG